MFYQLKRKRIQKSADPENQNPVEPKKRRKILLLILLLLLFASNLLLFKQLLKSRKTIIYQQQVLTTVQEPPDASSEVSGKWYGLCKKNSIHSMEDFKSTVANDDLLLNHFADFDWSNARMGTLERSIWTHVAYRKGEMISTTRRVIRLPKGDGYITDGRRWLRTYCCNDYILAEPSEIVAAPDRDLDRLLSSGKEFGTEGRGGSTAIPEPSTLLLMGFGISAVALMSWRQRSNSPKT